MNGVNMNPSLPYASTPYDHGNEWVPLQSSWPPAWLDHAWDYGRLSGPAENTQDLIFYD